MIGTTMVFRLGDSVSLKPDVPENRFNDECMGLPRTTGRAWQKKVVPGNPLACWHNPCRVMRIFQDGGLLLQNAGGFVRQADPDTAMKRYD